MTHTTRKRRRAMQHRAYNNGYDRFGRDTAYKAGRDEARRQHHHRTQARLFALCASTGVWVLAAVNSVVNPGYLFRWPVSPTSGVCVCLAVAAAAFWLAYTENTRRRTHGHVLRVTLAGAVLLAFFVGSGMLAPVPALLFVLAPALTIAGFAVWRLHETGAMEADYRRARKDHAITCRRCHRLALPVPGTQRWYRCTCGQQFTTRARHGF